MSVKNDEPNRFVRIVSPSCTNDVNSYAWKPRNVAPAIAVAMSQNLDDPRSPCVAGLALVLDRREREHHGQRRHQQHERRHAT